MAIDVDFASLRPWGRGQDTAFEELCCQIARAEALNRGEQFVRLGTPDGGVESYSVDANGDEHGLQSKFFLGSPTIDQWSKLTSSIKKAIEKHPRLVTLTVAMPSDRADPRLSGEQWFMDKWNHYEAEWRKQAISIGRTVKFHYMGKSEIAEALSREEHAGRYRWWFNRPLLSRRWLSDRLDEVIEQIGPRYNRTLTVSVPAGRKIAHFARLPLLLRELESRATTIADLIDGLAPQDSSRLHDLSAILPRPMSSESPVFAPHVTPPFEEWRKAWSTLGTAAKQLVQTESARSGSAVTSRHRELSKLADTCDEAVKSLDDGSPAYRAQAMLLWGDAGAGKTHLLCDTARLALERGQPAVVVLGQQLGVDNPWTEIMKALRFEGEAETFLQALSARAEASGQRALLLIDAINENNGLQVWPDHLAGFLMVARRFPWIGVVLSVRTIAKEMIVPDHLSESKLLQVEHTGFRETPVEAVQAFFDHYKLPLPAAPPSLFRELSNPLLLRLFCQAARQDGGLLSRPVPGLSRIIAAVFRDIDTRARRVLSTSPYQSIARACCEALAAEMLRLGRANLPVSDAASLLQAQVPCSPGVAYEKTPLAVLISEGLLTEDFVRHVDTREPSRVVRFAFERIGDHLTAEAILASLTISPVVPTVTLADEIASRLPTTDSATNSPTTYRLRTLLEAMAVVVPEYAPIELTDIGDAMKRAGVAFSHRTRERSITKAWVRGLLLREGSSITESTREQLAHLVVGDPTEPSFPLSEIRREAIRVALLLTAHPDQPLKPGWLHSILKPMVMPERDRRWTSQLRGHNSRSKIVGRSPYRPLLEWVRTAPADVLRVIVDGEVTAARLAAEALLWALPSPDRFLRDSATRAIVATTEHDPGIVPGLLELAAKIDDGYVVERVLGVACAAITAGNIEPIPAAAALRRFVECAGLPVHVLSRDYLATAISHLSQTLTDNIALTFLRENAMPPYSANWPGPLGTPDFERLKIKYPQIPPSLDMHSEPADPQEEEVRRKRLRSEGYAQVIGSLDHLGDFHSYVMHVGRPYGFEFAAQRLDEPTDGQPLTDFDLSVLPGWVFARVIELGWSPESFGEADADISYLNSTRSSHKEERFGKKYQWLAWHEALARISGTQRFRDRDSHDVGAVYEGAWQLDARDFDSTHLLDRPKVTATRWWQDLWTIPPLATDVTVQPSPYAGDGPIPITATDQKTSIGPWWFPVPDMLHPIVPLDQDPVVSLSSWATDASDLPDIHDYLVLNANLNDWQPHSRGEPSRAGRRYRLLSAFRHLIQRTEDRNVAHADLIVSVDGALIRRDDLPALGKWTGAQPLNGHSFDVSFTDALYLGEWPTGAVYRANSAADFRPAQWKDAVGTDALGLGIPAIIMTERYCWEGGIYDCSLPATLNVHILTSAPAALFPGLRHRNGAGVTANGELLHLDPEPVPGGAGGLFIDEAILGEALEREGLVLVQIIRQSKQVMAPDGDYRFAGQVTQTRLVGTVGSEKLCDIVKYYRQEPRLTE